MSDNQQTFLTNGDPVGFVTQVGGLDGGFVRATSIDGQTRVLRVGDPIFPGEKLVSVAGGKVIITFEDQTDLEFSNSEETLVDGEMFGLADADEDDELSFIADSTSEFDALQQAILAGQDPTLNQEAPAAGETTEEGDGGTDTTADIERSGQEATPTYGYDTGAQANAVQQQEVEAAEIDTVAIPGDVTVDNITADDVINLLESQATITVTGTAVGGDISAGDPVVMNINGTEYATTVLPDGTWSIDVLGSDLVEDLDFEVVVSSTDNVGNEVDSIGQSDHTIDLSVGTVSIDSISEDT
ncbi:MAG: retention module-containing protein, partial [Pseudomonadota bacterium]|nr:retention module-containing protein [Pseudomonadota bacterium]